MYLVKWSYDKTYFSWNSNQHKEVHFVWLCSLITEVRVKNKPQKKCKVYILLIAQNVHVILPLVPDCTTMDTDQSRVLFSQKLCEQLAAVMVSLLSRLHNETRQQH